MNERCSISYRCKINDNITISYYNNYDVTTPSINYSPRVCLEMTNGDSALTSVITFAELQNIADTIRTLRNAYEILPNTDNEGV